MKFGGEARVIRVSSSVSFVCRERIQLCNSHPVPPFLFASVHHGVGAFQKLLGGIALDRTGAADRDGCRELFSFYFDPGIADDHAEFFTDRQEHLRVGVREEADELPPQRPTVS